MARIDLTKFGFTPTESLVYEALLTNGEGTGYAIARAARLARANAYSALEGLVAKGAARLEPGRPKRYRAESPAGLITRISNQQSLALDRLSSELQSLAAPDTPTLVEIESSRAVLQLITHEVTRAAESVALLAPPEAFPLLAPSLRRPLSAGVRVQLWSTSPVELGFTQVGVVSTEAPWPGHPIILIVDQRGAILATRQGNEVHGHWSSAPWFIAGARLALERLSSHD